MLMTLRIWMIACWMAGCMATYAQKVSVTHYYGERQGVLTLTFDDGLLEHYTEVFPRLRQFGLKASFGIIGSKVGQDHKGVPCMGWQHLREMAADGQEMTSHGWQHRSMESLTGEELRYEVQHNDSLIYQHTGIFPRTYFYPGNRKTNEGIAFASHDRVGTRMQQLSFGSKRDSLWVDHLLQRTLKSGEWTVTMTHGITVGYDAFTDAGLLWYMFEQAADRQDSLWVATLHDALSYQTERDSTSLNIQLGEDIMTVTPVCTLDQRLFHHPLTMRVEGKVEEAYQQGKPLKLEHKGTHTLLNFDPHGGSIAIVLQQRP